MDYQVTARKWRPKRFEDVVGQEHITATLKNAIKSNRIAHAYILTGPRGVGKTTTARILAKALNCENLKDSEPCNNCKTCKAINDAQSMDIIEIDGASNRGIDEIRTLRESVKYAPTQGKYKVYIIDEVHMLTKESFNAFLKTLEEPPSHTLFVFATTDIHKVPPTIISRCQRFDFRRIQLDTIKSQLKKIAENEKIKIDDKTLTIIAKKADGALRDAQSLFDQVISFAGNKIDSETVSKMLNLIDEEVYFNISNAILEKNFNEVFTTTEMIYQNGWDFIDFLDGLIEHFRNILTFLITGKSDLVETAEVYKTKYAEYEDQFSKGDILRILNYLSKAQQELKFSNNQKLKIEIILTNLVGFEKSATISELLNNIESESFNADNKIIPSQKSSQTNQDSYTPIKKKEPVIDSPKIPVSKNIPQADYSIPINSLNELDDITIKWKGFLEEITKEKALTLAPLVSSFNPTSFDGTILKLHSSDELAEETISLHKEYLDKKSRSYFGKKINLQFSSKKEKKASKSEVNTSNDEKTSKSTGLQDPYEKIIVEELGGQQIS